ncbi:MAG: c-type cytochrome [Rhodospirillaceae bacterium]|nr:c-type cytochrome [Rhodospirillaceae bacterium]
MNFLRHPLLLSVLAAVVLYLAFAYGLQPPLPKSLLIQYMIFSVIGIIMVGTFNDETAKQMAAPIRALLGQPNLAALRAVVGVLLVVGVGWFSYDQVKPNLDAPVELRTVHPAPPGSIRVYGKSFNLLKLTNPLREKAAKGSDEYREMVGEGGELYYKNCIYCHGDLLDGRGHFADGFNPRPANFQDVGTIAQLQESYLFWRITTGGPGLPRNAAPWASAMPVWHEMLSEDEVWKIILFLYDYTGHVPRSWELETKEEGDASAKADDTAPADGKLSKEQVTAVYQKRCAHCHGDEGDGMGPAAEFMYPLPRDFTLASFKYKTTHADDEFPTDADLYNTIAEGLPGTSMPAWKDILTKAEIDALIHQIKVFGEWEEEEIEHQPIAEGTRVASTPESVARGRELFVKACVQCHGDKGRGNVTSGKVLKDDWEQRIWPRNLTRPRTWRATFDTQDVFQRISTGIRSTPMPEHTTVMKENDRWDIANYVMTLRDTAVPVDPAKTVLRGVRVAGDLPTSSDDPAWDMAAPTAFSMVPNIIKEPRLYWSLNDTVVARVLFNDTDVAIRLDVDDRTYSVPGDKLEKQYRLKDVPPTADAVAVQFPVVIPETSEKPWFRHGDKKHPVNMWYWRAPSAEPKVPAIAAILDATGPGAKPAPRTDSGLSGSGAWKDGQWSVVFRRKFATEDEADLQFEAGRYIPIAFGNWDGLAGEKGGRHAFSTWYWLLLEPEARPAVLYGVPTGMALLAALLFVLAVRRQRRSFEMNAEN